MTAKEIEQVKKKPPVEAIESVQMSLFSNFVSNDQDKISNTIEIWEKIPKYFFTPKQVEKLREESGLAQPFEWTYEEEGKECTVVFQPALIKQKDGTFKAFFPSITEELVEEALKKFLTDQNFGIHDPKNQETWVRFSLSMISAELKARGRERNRNQIKQAISVMSGCVISLYRGKKEIWKGAILQDLVTVEREGYIEDPKAYHIGRLPLFISHAIDRLETRQFNYDRLMHCNEQLSRWIYKKLINRFRQADFMNNYHFMYSELKHSGLLQQSVERNNRIKVIAALEELKEQGVIMSYSAGERKEKRKILDVKYTIFPSRDFIAEQKAANKRKKNNSQAALAVDK